MAQFIMIIVSAVFINNFVVVQFLGICPFLGVSKKTDSALSMGIAVTLVMVIATAATWPIYTYLLYPNFTYLQTVVFILVIAAIVQLIEVFLKRYIKPIYNALGIYLPLITTNCAVLGVALTVVQKSSPFAAAADGMFNLGEATVYAFATSLGFGLAMVLFAGLREQLALNNVPKAFKGIPIALVTAGILAMAFMGFSGLV